MRRPPLVAVIAAVAVALWLGRRAIDFGSSSGATAANLIVITVDTLRADRVGAYGHAAARTPTIDRLAREGTRVDTAYAAAPITLPSHATLLSGLYPAHHGARHNGIAIANGTPTLATALDAANFHTAAFVAAFPLDKRFGLAQAFDVYDDALGHGADGRARDERPGSAVVDAAMAWFDRRGPGRFFLWVHLFEPHAPYGSAAAAPARSALERYDDDVAEADRQVGRLIDRLRPVLDQSLLVVTSDHGEAFGEHGELAHSVFVYDTTLRVPLVIRGPGIRAGQVLKGDVGLVDIAPTALARLGLAPIPMDGLDLSAALNGRTMPARALYAESFAPLVDFGWAPLRSQRQDGWKYIAAPQPELFNVAVDPGETTNRDAAEPAKSAALDRLVAAISGPELGSASTSPIDPESVRRLGALGYVGRGGGDATSNQRPDPKTRREQAARLAQITSGELQGDALVDALRAVLIDEPANPQANMRLGFALQSRGDCAAALRSFDAAIAANLPSADPYLGRAACLMSARDADGARRALERANAVEPGNAVVEANLGLIESAAGRHASAIRWLSRAIATDPEFHEARFNLALAFARSGDRDAAAREARELLKRLPADAAQRSEVTRLLQAVSGVGR